MPRWVFASLLLLAGWAYAVTPAEYAKKEDIRTEATVVGDEITFTFGFKDLAGTYGEWSWKDSTQRIETLSRSFGLLGKDPGNLRYRPEELPAAMFKEHPIVGLLPDYSAIATRYYDSVRELHARWKEMVEKQGLSRRRSVEALLVFFQDFPYGQPPRFYDDRLIAGLFVPPLVFKNGWADCDSKAILMATVLSHEDAFAGKMAMILVPGHALLGLEIEPGPYDEIYEHQNRKYVAAEPTGLARTPLGRRNSPYDQLLAVEPIRIGASLVPSAGSQGTGATAPPGASVIEFTPATPPRPAANAGAELKILTKADCPDGGILTDYKSASDGTRVQACFVNKGGQIIKHGPEVTISSDGKPEKRRDFSMGKLAQ